MNDKPALLALDRAVAAWTDSRARGDPVQELAVAHAQLSSARAAAGDAAPKVVRRFVQGAASRAGNYERVGKNVPTNKRRTGGRSEISADRLDAAILTFLVCHEGTATLAAVRVHFAVRHDLVAKSLNRLTAARKIVRRVRRFVVGSAQTRVVQFHISRK